MIAGLFFVNGENWDEGRFLPFGWSGVWTHAIHPHLNTQSYIYYTILDTYFYFMDTVFIPLNLQTYFSEVKIFLLDKNNIQLITTCGAIVALILDIARMDIKQ